MTATELYRAEKAKREGMTAEQLAAAKAQFDELMARWTLDRRAPTPHNHPLRPMRGKGTE